MPSMSTVFNQVGDYYAAQAMLDDDLIRINTKVLVYDYTQTTDRLWVEGNYSDIGTPIALPLGSYRPLGPSITTVTANAVARVRITGTNGKVQSVNLVDNSVVIRGDQSAKIVKGVVFTIDSGPNAGRYTAREDSVRLQSNTRVFPMEPLQQVSAAGSVLMEATTWTLTGSLPNDGPLDMFNQGRLYINYVEQKKATMDKMLTDIQKARNCWQGAIFAKQRN